MIQIVKYVVVVLILAHVGRICGFIISPTPTKHAGFERSTQRFSTLQDISNTTKGTEDPTIRKYSRCLASQDQISEEILSQTRWKSVVKKRIKTMKRVIKRSKKNHGTLILVRGGETEYAEGDQRFTGWSDPPLTKEGVQQMEHAGRLLLESGYSPDVIYTSRLKRAIKSAWVILQEIDMPFLPVHKSWRLNERHYGSLEGNYMNETVQTFGADVVQAWRQTHHARPPPVGDDDPNYPGHNRKYSDLSKSQIPRSESIADCMKRSEPLWKFIQKEIVKGENVMIVTHSNTLRGLARIIDDIEDDNLAGIIFPRGVPVVYKFDDDMNPIMQSDLNLKHRHTSGCYLGKVDPLDNINESGMKSEYDEYVNKKSVILTQNALLDLKDKHELSSNGSPTLSMNELSTNNNEIIQSKEGMPRRFTDTSANLAMNYDTINDPVVVLIRHGRTPHNILALFTGWEDVPLADEGVEDARWAGRLLKDHGFEFDVIYTSWLCRAIETAYFVLEEMDQLWLPIVKSWRLNERHYGDLTGKSKKMVANIYGEEQLKKWRRGYKTRPPPVSSYSFNYPGNDKKRTKFVTDLPISLTESFCRSIEDRKFTIHRKFPKSESLHDCMKRSIPYYTQKIVPEAVERGKRVLISSHENAIRGILMHLCDIPEECMNDLHLPNGVPLVYNVKRKCISILDDGSGEDPLEKYEFGKAAKYLFEKECELD